MISLRHATIDDADVLYKWRCDPLTVENSTGPPPATFDAHVQWLTGRLAKEHGGWLFIAMHDGHPVGAISIEATTRQVGITIAPEWRGQGFATPMIRALCEEAAQHQLLPVIAIIKKTNQISVRAFRAAGFTIETGPDGDFVGTWNGRQ